MRRTRLSVLQVETEPEPVKVAAPEVGTFSNEPPDPLEILSMLAERGSHPSVKSGRGVTALDIAMAFGMAIQAMEDRAGGAMAAALACRRDCDRDEVVTELVEQVVRDENKRGKVPDLLQVGEQCLAAFNDAVRPPRTSKLGQVKNDRATPLAAVSAPREDMHPYYRAALSYMEARGRAVALETIRFLKGGRDD